MIASKSLFALVMANCAAAHFGLDFPEWRADTLAEENEEKYSQWTYPCMLKASPHRQFFILTCSRRWC